MYGKSEAFHTFAAAWDGLAARYLAALDEVSAMRGNDDATQSVTFHARLQFERRLFNFINLALSSIDCFAISAYAAGSIATQGGRTFNKYKAHDINLHKTYSAYLKRFPDRPITDALSSLDKNTDYRQWRALKLSLSHQTMLSNSGLDNSYGLENADVGYEVVPNLVDLVVASNGETLLTQLLGGIVSEFYKFVDSEFW